MLVARCVEEPPPGKTKDKQRFTLVNGLANSCLASFFGSFLQNRLEMTFQFCQCCVTLKGEPFLGPLGNPVLSKVQDHATF